MGNHFHGPGRRAQRRPGPGQREPLQAPSAISSVPANHLQEVREPSAVGGRRSPVSGSVSADALPITRLGGVPPASPIPSAEKGRVSRESQVSRDTLCGEGSCITGSGLVSPEAMPGSSSASSVSIIPIGWCSAPVTVQRELVQLGISTPLDLCGFFDAEEGVVESFQGILHGTDLVAAVAAWRESTAASRLYVRRLVRLGLHQTHDAAASPSATSSTIPSSSSPTETCTMDYSHMGHGHPCP